MYKLHLILKYLLKRRIAWVSLFAVTLCTTMVLVVISVMGGWLNMFKSSFRGLSGDIVIHAETLQGFPYYQQIIDALVKEPGSPVQAAVPSIETYGLLNFGTGPIAVNVMGIPIAQMGTVNQFPESLYLQHGAIEEALKDPKLPADERARLERKLKEPPSFDLLDQVYAPLDKLPVGVTFAKPKEGQQLEAGTIELPSGAPAGLAGRLRYDVDRRNLVFRGRMKFDWKEAIAALSPDPEFRKAVDVLYADSQQADLIDYQQLAKGKSHGLIVGVGVIGIHRDRQGKWDRPGPVEFIRPIGLTVLDLSTGKINANSQVSRNYFIVDDSHIGVWQYDNKYVYVPLELLQSDLGMNAQKVEIDGKPAITPARVTDIHVKVKPGIDPNDENQLIAIKGKIQGIVHQVMTQQQQAGGGEDLIAISSEPKVETWQDMQRIWISAVENEKLLTVILFGIISVVAIFLIFCIFYMIVVEKTRDIGIIKSVGATSAGVAGIFLGYGLVIGLIGAAMGLLLSYLIIHNINEMHAWLGRAFGVQIWNPEVYLFDKIPNTMNVHDIAWIVPAAVLSSVLGALIPAVRAARLNPVEALRWE